MTDARTDGLAPPADPGAGPGQFTLFTRWLHWVMALLIVAMIFIGAGMTASLADYSLLVSVHEPLGAAVLFLAVVRLVNRLMHRGPALPKSMSASERLAAKASEGLLYALMLAQPLIGWGMVSASGKPLALFGTVDVPAVVPTDPELYAVLHRTHLVFGYALFLLFTLHMLAILVHVLVKRDGLFSRMALWKGPRRKR
ncbi:cytochrome b [Streptomyces sp. SID10853]|uniref:cytochrome b n=1 Tax=Streptomyces sp. SID10853 TaxID=2706028 RepID=UPI0013C29593|nr:cytochrome b [Streptomyces sp. SID10853]NDZ81210.1 cytochrome b [Streptomyces sp. SID10853]